MAVVGTVGQPAGAAGFHQRGAGALQVSPLDLRAPTNAEVRRPGPRRVNCPAAAIICERRGGSSPPPRPWSAPPQCDAAHQKAPLERAVTATGLPTLQLPSAGHDAMCTPSCLCTCFRGAANDGIPATTRSGIQYQRRHRPGCRPFDWPDPGPSPRPPTMTAHDQLDTRDQRHFDEEVAFLRRPWCACPRHAPRQYYPHALRTAELLQAMGRKRRTALRQEVQPKALPKHHQPGRSCRYGSDAFTIALNAHGDAFHPERVGRTTLTAPKWRTASQLHAQRLSARATLLPTPCPARALKWWRAAAARVAITYDEESGTLGPHINIFARPHLLSPTCWWPPGSATRWWWRTNGCLQLGSDRARRDRPTPPSPTAPTPCKVQCVHPERAV